MARLRYNNKSDATTGTVTIGAGGGSQTATFSVAPNFPTLASPDIIPLVIEPDTANEEVVYVTAYTNGQTTATVLTGQEGTSAIAHSGKAWVCGPTAQDFGGSSTDGTLAHTPSTTSLPWWAPWGKVAVATPSGNTSGVSAETDMTGASVSVNVVAHRLYKVTFLGTLIQSTSSGTVQTYVNIGGSDVQNEATTVGSGNYAVMTNVYYWSNPAAGATTVKMRMSTSAGTVATSFAAGNTGLLLVEDIGPYSAPV